MPGRTSQENLHSIGTNLGTLAVAGGAVVAVNEAVKAIESEDHTVKHAIHAGLGAAAAAGAYEMVRRANKDSADDNNSRGAETSTTEVVMREGDVVDTVCERRSRRRSSSRSSKRSRSRSSSRSSDEEHAKRKHHHKIHLAEEVAGAWGAVKQALGDKDHKKMHMVEEVLGAVGLYQESKGHHKHHH